MVHVWGHFFVSQIEADKQHGDKTDLVDAMREPLPARAGKGAAGAGDGGGGGGGGAPTTQVRSCLLLACLLVGLLLTGVRAMQAIARSLRRS